MRLLLDTHAFIWWADEPEKLSESVLHACQYHENHLILSIVSIWEMQIKMQIGKLRLSVHCHGNDCCSSFPSPGFADIMKQGLPTHLRYEAGAS